MTRLRRYSILVIGVWSLALVALFLADSARTWSDIRGRAIRRARETFHKDYTFRLWATSHGGVYVPLTDKNPPNKLIEHLPERDVQTPSGGTLTLVTPHRVIHQIQKDFSKAYEAKSRLTSLLPSRPENAPDRWERAALQRLVTRDSAVMEFTEIEGEPYLRLMKPLVTTKECLKCHADQGYKQGDIHGGIAVSQPMKRLMQQGRHEIIASIMSYGAIYLLGLAGIVFGMRRLGRREQERDQAVKDLERANEKLESRVEARTMELQKTNHALRLEIFQREEAQDALRQSEVRYRRLVLSAPLGILSVNQEGRITEANPALLKILGPLELTSEGPVNLYTLQPMVDSGIAGDFRKCLENSESFVSERVLVSGSGQWVAVRLHLAPVRNRSNTMVGAQAVVDDITDRYRALEALRISEQRFRSLFESATEIIHVLDMHGSIVQSNPMAVKALGYTLAELVGLPIESLLSPESRASFPAEFAKLMERGYHRYDAELMSKDGAIIRVDSSCSALRDPSGTIVSFVLFQRDITDQKRAEEQIERQNEFLGAVLESLTHPFYVIDANTYEVVLANASASRSFIPEGSTCYALTHGLSEPCNSSCDPCPVEELKRTRSSATVEHVHYDRNGQARTFEIHAHPIFDSSGEIAQVIEYSLDITERKRAEHALRESEERMRLVIESSPVGIAIAQHERYQYANPAFVKMFGYGEPEEIVGKPIGIVCVPEDVEVLLRGSTDVLDGGTLVQFSDIKGLKKDRSEFEANVWLTGIQHQQAPGVLLFVTDVSQERKLRSQLLQVQKMDAIGTLAAGIAHDFNNLLQAIHGYAELALLKAKEGEPGYKEFQVIISAARRAGELTTGLLTFSRQVASKRRPVDLNREIQEITRLLARALPILIQTELYLAPDLRAINADPAQLQQVVMNLAVNARDAMQDRGRLSIETQNIALDARYSRTHPGLASGNYVVLSVSDTGCGMDEATRERIFEPFFSTKARGSGTGLGLSIVYGIVKGHGGHIGCYSEPGVGTTFTIHLPVVDVPDETARAAPEEQIVGGTETILLVDDEAPLRTLGKEILSRFGYSVITADNGIEALLVLQRDPERVSLVILDIMMPELSGWECLEEILAINPSAKVIIASGYAADAKIGDAAGRGAKAFLRKPYEAKSLLTLVRRVLDEESA